LTAGSDCDDSDAILQPTDQDGDGFSTCDGDCNDQQYHTCPGVAFNNSIAACMTDVDGDGWGSLTPEAGAVTGSDCDDLDPDTYFGAATYDSSILCMTDVDGDGYGETTPATGVSAGTDCDDNNATLNSVDADFDGFSTCSGDCDDSDNSFVERLGDGKRLNVSCPFSLRSTPAGAFFYWLI